METMHKHYQMEAQVLWDIILISSWETQMMIPKKGEIWKFNIYKRWRIKLCAAIMPTWQSNISSVNRHKMGVAAQLWTIIPFITYLQKS